MPDTRRPTVPLADDDRYDTSPEPIARGGMGVVWSAYDRRLGRQIAVKSLRPGLVASPHAFDRFAHEVAIQSSLVHPGIVPVYESRMLDDPPCFTMKLVSGQPLSRLLRDYRQRYAGRPREWFHSADCRRIIEWLVAVCHTMAYVHQQGIVHRDLTPANILIGRRNGEVFVSDWGIASTRHEAAGADTWGIRPLIADAGAGQPLPPSRSEQPPVSEWPDTRTGTRLGTVGYMAPEQRDARRATPASDVYSLGRILQDLTTVPDRGRSESIVRTVEPDSAVPPGLRHVVTVATRLEPSQRYGSADAMRTDLQHEVLEHAGTESWFLRLMGRIWQGDAPALEQLFGPDAEIRVGVGRPPLCGIGQLRSWQRALLAGFPDLSVRTNALLAGARGQLAWHATLSGTRTGPFLGYPPDGARMDANMAWVCGLEGPRIVRAVCTVDLMSVATQLGLVRTMPGRLQP